MATEFLISTSLSMRCLIWCKKTWVCWFKERCGCNSMQCIEAKDFILFIIKHSFIPLLLSKTKASDTPFHVLYLMLQPILENCCKVKPLRVSLILQWRLPFQKIFWTNGVPQSLSESTSELILGTNKTIVIQLYHDTPNSSHFRTVDMMHMMMNQRGWFAWLYWEKLSLTAAESTDWLVGWSEKIHYKIVLALYKLLLLPIS